MVFNKNPQFNFQNTLSSLINKINSIKKTVCDSYIKDSSENQIRNEKYVCFIKKRFNSTIKGWFMIYIFIK